MDEPPPIVTERLTLVPLRPETLDALIACDLERASEAQQMDLRGEFAASLDEYFLRVQLDRMSRRPSGRGWCARAMVQNESGAPVGNCGFHGPPEDVGRAEIGYFVLSSFRSRGYATEAAEALVEYARGEGVDAVFASVALSNGASLAVVRKLGFVQTGVQLDEIDGEEAVFELQLS